MPPQKAAISQKGTQAGPQKTGKTGKPTASTSTILQWLDELRQESEEPSDDGGDEMEAGGGSDEESSQDSENDSSLSRINEGGEDNNEEGSSEDDDGLVPEPLVVLPQKRSKASVNKRKKKARTQEIDDAGDTGTPPPPEPVMINYNLLFYSSKELKQPICRRQPKAGYLVLNSNIPWDDFYGQIKIKVCDVLFPGKAVVDEASFEVFFQIARHIPNPLPLNSAADYAHLLTNASKINKNLAVKISINSRAPNLEPGNENAQPSGAPNAPALAPALALALATAPKKKKSKAPNENDILPANVAMNAKILELRQQWECNLTTCHLQYCFIPADGPHLTLGHNHFEKWAAAILRGDNFATIQKPPNINIFDTVSTHTMTERSPILQARLNAMSKEKPVALAPVAPVVNVVLPNNLFGAYNLPMPVLPPPPPLSVPTPLGLIPASYKAGPKLDMATFCTIFKLSDAIYQRLTDNAYTGTQAFAHMDPAELHEIGFKPGEIVDLKEAVKDWAVYVK